MASLAPGVDILASNNKFTSNEELEGGLQKRWTRHTLYVKYRADFHEEVVL
jgi:hypothetical protein